MFDGENISFDASLVIYRNSTNIPPVMIINRIYEHRNLLSMQLVSFLVGLRTYQHPCTYAYLYQTRFMYCYIAVYTRIPLCAPFYIFLYTFLYLCGPDSAVGIATRSGLDGPGIEFRSGRNFPHASRPALIPTPTLPQWVAGLSQGKVTGSWI